MGSDVNLRREGIQKAACSGDLVLDLGSGLGMMSRILLESGQEVKELVMCDVLIPMLTHTRCTSTLKQRERVNGLFETLPFANSTFDLVMMGFALRDAKSMDQTLFEVARVLKNNGKLLVVDMGKPNNTFLDYSVGIYWRLIAPLIAWLKVGRRGLLFAAIHRTYRTIPRNRELKDKVGDFFEVELDEKMMGSAVILIAQKDGKSSPFTSKRNLRSA